jgi:hypothetical protein
MKVVPQEVVYAPKFTYIWTLTEARFPEEAAVKMPREEAVRELARSYLSNHQLVDEKFADRLETGVYQLCGLRR